MGERSKKPRRLVRIIGYGCFLAVPVLLAMVVEMAGYLYLSANGLETYRPLLRRSEIREAEGLFDRRDSFSYLDPHLGHAHRPGSIEAAGYEYMPGFAVVRAGEASAPLIIALGGSTTDPLGGKGWVDFFAEQLDEAGYKARLLNGGVAGYSSNQELLKLIRDVMPLKPDLVISLNGVNDLGFMHCSTNHPMVHPYQKRILSHLARGGQSAPWLLPNAVGAVLALTASQPDVGLNLGTVVDHRDDEHWLSNVRMMHAVAEELGAIYLCFLQPILGVGGYVPSVEEQAMLDQTIQQHASYRDYEADMLGFYDRAVDAAKNLPYVLDGTEVFQRHSGMYRDSRHQTPAGCEVLAEFIFATCEAQGVLTALWGNPTPDK